MKTRILKFFLVLALAAVICLPAVAMATVLNFDDINSNSNNVTMPSPYGGFTWTGSNALYVIANSWYRDHAPYYQNTYDFPSNPNAFWTSGSLTVTNTTHTPFIFEGGDFGEWLQVANRVQPYSAHSLTITGYLGANLVGTQTITFSTYVSGGVTYGVPLAYTSVNWGPVDKLVFQGSGGTGGNYFLMDNFTYEAAPVPLPPSALLLGSGLLGLALLRRKWSLKN